MTLSLDDVRNKRFRMARKSGYEVLEVDEFVDEIEESFAQLIEENQNLKKQVEALKSSTDGATAEAPTAAPEPAPVETPAPAPQPVREQPAATPPQTIVVTTAKEASSAVVRLVELSTEQAERLVAEATEEAQQIRADANSNAHQVTTDARTRAERVESEARVNAERVQAQTVSRSEQLEREIDQRRSELLDHLESQREELSNSVRDLRNFEAAYRANLTDHLRTQIATLESGKAEPASVPGLVVESGPQDESPTEPAVKESASADSDESQAETTVGGTPVQSETPRLDALLGDQR